MNQEDLQRFDKLQSLRAVTVFAIFATVAEIFQLGLPSLLLGVFAAIGVRRSGRLLQRESSLQRTIGELIVTALGIIFLPTLLSLFLKSLGLIDSESLSGVVLSDSVFVLGLAYLGTFLSTTLFWKYRGYLTIEAAIVATSAFALVSGHRNYQLDAPKELSQFAWKLGVESQNFFIGFGIIICLFLGAFLAIAHARPIFGEQLHYKREPLSRVTAAFRLLLPLTLFGLLLAYAGYISSKYTDNLSRASEGVGEGSDEGKSPLGFHSAVGKTKQPAALVRFEGDYKSNPWAPMLYLREGALSSFNGKEMVLAPRDLDNDVPRITPGQPYLAIEKEASAFREEVKYSVFLLAKHKTPIAIDYPKSIQQIKNPDPNRFVSSYNVLSIAPKVKLDSLTGEEFGDPNWPEETRKHYLRGPGDLDPNIPLPVDLSKQNLDPQGEDLRYKALSKELTKDLITPYEKVTRIIDYLSQSSIYTRQPGHQVTEGGDPVAPYLFSQDKRGYCVHFAHAAVYLLRLAGIPARIGTGYLTDLSFAKDGHVLLNMGDRHAWPEVYVQGLGWTVFDVQPAKAENEQVQPPDEKLLEELMSKLDELGEMTPPIPTEDQNQSPSFGDQVVDVLSDRGIYVRIVLALLIVFVLIKLWLRAGYLLTNNLRKKAVLGYVSLASLHADLGNPRRYAETRLEYLRRLHNDGKISSIRLADFSDEAKFGPAILSYSESDIQTELKQARLASPTFKRSLQQLVAFLSPLSLTRWGRW